MLAENAVILVIHRGQRHPGNEEKIMSISPASGFASGLHLGTPAAKLHLLQLLAYGRYGEPPNLVAGSDVNKQNQQLLFHLLQEILQVIRHHVYICISLSIPTQLHFWLHKFKYWAVCHQANPANAAGVCLQCTTRCTRLTGLLCCSSTLVGHRRHCSSVCLAASDQRAQLTFEVRTNEVCCTPVL